MRHCFFLLWREPAKMMKFPFLATLAGVASLPEGRCFVLVTVHYRQKSLRKTTWGKDYFGSSFQSAVTRLHCCRAHVRLSVVEEEEDSKAAHSQRTGGREQVRMGVSSVGLQPPSPLTKPHLPAAHSALNSPMS